MNEIRYLLDENVNPILRSALLRENQNLTVWQVGMLGAPVFGTLDPEILICARKTNFCSSQTTANQCPFTCKTISPKIAAQPEFSSSTPK